MSWKLSELAQELDLKWQGSDLEIVGCNTLEEASENEITFLANPKYKKKLSSTRAGAVVLAFEHASLFPCALISQNPYWDFGRVVQLFAQPEGSFTGISEQAFVHPQAQVADDVTIYPFVYIGSGSVIESGCFLFSGVYIGENCHLQENCILYPNVSLMSKTTLGQGVVLHAGVVIGSDGFGFAQSEDIREKIPQIGHVCIDDNVEIGANSTIDRATLGQTRVGRNTKIDNQVQIGHNVQIGPNSVLVAQVGIAGSTKIGQNVILAGQVGVAGHLEIGDNCRAGGKSGITKSLKPNSDVSGYPAIEHKTFLRLSVLQSKLPEMYERIKKLEKKINQVIARLRPGGINHDS